MSVWLGLPTIDPERDVFLALDGDKPIAYLIANMEPPLKRVVLEGAVHPDHLHRGAGTRLVEASVDMASGLGYEIIQMAFPFGALNTRRLAKRCGFRFIRKFWEMKLDDPSTVPDPGLSSEFQIRPFRDGDEDRLRFIQNLSFAKHWGYSPNRPEDVHYKVRMGLFSFDDILLVLDGDTPVGFNWTRLERSDRKYARLDRNDGRPPRIPGQGPGHVHNEGRRSISERFRRIPHRPHSGQPEPERPQDISSRGVQKTGRDSLVRTDLVTGLS